MSIPVTGKIFAVLCEVPDHGIIMVGLFCAHQIKLSERFMNKDLRLAFCRGDLFAILLVVCIALGTVFAFMPAGAEDETHAVQIYQSGKLLHELPLDGDTILEIEGDYKNTVSVSGGRVCISKSDCPGGDCVHSGAISAPGRSIVCLPNRVEVRITGMGDVDFVLR